jgi:hypothetical protein
METPFSIDQNTIILMGCAALAVYVLLKVASKLLRGGLLVAIVLLGAYFWNGGTVDDLKELGTHALFRERDLTRLIDRYCDGSKENSLKCDCIVRPVQADLLSRFSEAELLAMANDEEARIEAIRQSMRNQREAIRACVVKEKGGDYWDRIKNAVEAANAELKKEPN